MTILDEVLQAETDAATKIAAAEAEAVSQIADAKKAQAEGVQAEKDRLDDAETKTLAEHANTVQTNSQAIVTAAEKEVAAIKATFDAHADKLQGKIKEAIA